MVSISTNIEEVQSSPFANLPLSSFVTSLARLRLYKLLELSDGYGYYCDTGLYFLYNFQIFIISDSIIALVPRNNNPYKEMIGDGLGFLNSETPGKTIRRSAFGG